MIERNVYRHDAAEVPPRCEWVTLAKGDVCVRELSMMDSLNIVERCDRHTNDRRPGPDKAQMAILQISMSCYYGEEDGERRVFADADALKIHKLMNWEMDALLMAINRVNGKDPAEQEALQDFTEATRAQNPSPSSGSASSTSNASLVKSGLVLPPFAAP